MQMNNQNLQELTEKWSLEYFQRPFQHQIVFNTRLKTTGGRYHLHDHHIDINPLMYTEYDLDTLRRVVLHELCHYHLHLTGNDYHHRSTAFRELLKMVGGSRFAPPTSATQKKIHYYQCAGCRTQIARQRRFNTNKYVCRRCGNKFFEINLKK